MTMISSLLDWRSPRRLIMNLLESGGDRRLLDAGRKPAPEPVGARPGGCPVARRHQRTQPQRLALVRQWAVREVASVLLQRRDIVARGVAPQRGEGCGDRDVLLREAGR